MRVDSHGGAWIWNVVCTIVGGAIGAGSQIVSNIVNDEPLFDGVLGATVSGGTAGLLISFGCTDPFLLSYGTTAAGAISEEVSDYVVTGKDFSYSSFVDSANKVFTTVVVDGTVNLVAGKMADKVAPVNMGEGTARTLKSAFTGKHAKKQWKNMAVSSYREYTLKNKIKATDEIKKEVTSKNNSGIINMITKVFNVFKFYRIV